MTSSAWLVAGLLFAADGEMVDSPLERGQALAAEGRWAEAARTLTPVVDPETASAGALALLTRVSLEAGDVRRARLLAERGLLRFPEDLRFRKLDLAVLVARRDWREARAAARSVLAVDPADPLAWRQLAAASLELEASPGPEARAALEAAHLANPEDREIFTRHLRAQLAADHTEAAADLAREGLRLAPSPDLVELGVRAAEAVKDAELARAWLGRVPPSERSTRLTLLEARVALAAGDPSAAEAALRRLIDRGEADPAVLVRAGKLAEDRGAFGRAEALYVQAAEGEGEAARVARLTLARLLAKIENHARARVVLEAYLAEHPSDAYARQLLRLVKSASD